MRGQKFIRILGENICVVIVKAHTLNWTKKRRNRNTKRTKMKMLKIESTTIANSSWISFMHFTICNAEKVDVLFFACISKLAHLNSCQWFLHYARNGANANHQWNAKIFNTIYSLLRTSSHQLMNTEANKTASMEAERFTTQIWCQDQSRRISQHSKLSSSLIDFSYSLELCIYFCYSFATEFSPFFDVNTWSSLVV